MPLPVACAGREDGRPERPFTQHCRRLATAVAVVVMCVALFGAVLAPMAFPLVVFGPEGYGQDGSTQHGPARPPATCNDVIDAWHFDRGNPHWDALGDTYLARMLISTGFSLMVAAMASLGFRSVPKTSAYAARVRGWLILNWLVAVFWCWHRSCSWCKGGASARSSYTALVHVACTGLWMARQLALAASLAWLSWLLRMRVVAIERAQASEKRSRVLAQICGAQVVLLLVAASLFIGRVLFDPKEERLNSCAQGLLMIIVLLEVAVLLIAAAAFWHPLRVAQEVACRAVSRRMRLEAALVVHSTRIHMAVTAMSAATSLVSVAGDLAAHVLIAYYPGSRTPAFILTKTATFGLDLVVNAATLLLLSGFLRCRGSVADGEGERKPVGGPCHRHEVSGCLAWDAKVRELSERGLTLAAIMNFYSKLRCQHMPHFDPDRHTTADVVLQAIIPATALSPWGPCALATLLMEGAPTPAQRMVTHTWSSKFVDLVAAVVADALGLPTYGCVRDRLEQGELTCLTEELQRKGVLQLRYWVCAFSVNQHAGICKLDLREAEGHNEIASLHQCPCGFPKWLNDTPPLQPGGASIGCETNKFDDMMSLLASRDPHFQHVVAVDCQFDLFTRSWCVAEISQAQAVHMLQVLLVHSQSSLDRHRGRLEGLRVEDTEASREEDKCMILSKIGNTPLFNERLRDMILDEDTGLLARWQDSMAFAHALGCIASRHAI